MSVSLPSRFRPSHTLAALNVLMIAGTMGGVALVPNNPRAVIVFAWPKPDRSAAIDVVARANGSLLRAGTSRWAVLATSENPDFVHLLYASGALLVLNGGVAGGCGGPQKAGYS